MLLVLLVVLLLLVLLVLLVVTVLGMQRVSVAACSVMCSRDVL